MALFKILSNMVDNNPPDPYGYIDNQEDAGLAQVRSEATGLPNTFNQGYCYFDRSTGKFWIDTTPTNSGTVTLSNKNDTSKSHVQGRIPINAYYADLAKLATSATYDDAGNTIASTYLKLSGGNMTGHIYLTGSQANSSTANTSQLIFGTPTTEHIAISSNTKALILNPTHSSTTNQIVLYLDKASKFPFGIEANVKGNLTGKATTAGTADIANSVAWNNVSSKPNLVNKITTTAGAHTAITNKTGNVSFNVPTTAAHVGAAAKEITVYNPPATFYIKTDFLASGTQNMIYGYLQGNGYIDTPPIHVDFQVYNYTATSLISGKQYDATGAIGQMSCFRGTDGYLYIKVERGAGNQTFKIFIYKMSHGNDENHAIEVLSTAPEMEAGSEHIFTKYTGIHSGFFTSAYDMIYSNASNSPVRLSANKTTTKKFLSMTGTGSAGATPVWSTVTQSDVGLSNVENTKLSTWTGSSKITTVGTLSSGTVPWARLSNIPTTFTPAAHTHGNITNDGKITGDGTTIGNGDRLVFVDATDSSNIIRKTDIAFDHATKTEFLSKEGSWISPIEYIKGTQTEITNQWTGITKDTTIYKGKIIAYHLPYASAPNENVTCNLTLTLDNGNGEVIGPTSVYEAHSGASGTGTIYLQEIYPAGTVLLLIYNGTRWQVINKKKKEEIPIPTTNQIQRPNSMQGTTDVTLQSLFNVNRGNHFAFLSPNQIIIEKTTDGGATWTDAGISDTIKQQLFSEARPGGVEIPLLNGVKNINCGLRVTITAMKYNVPAGTAETEKYNYWNSTYVLDTERYNTIHDIYFWVNSNSDRIKVKVERAKGSSSTTWETAFEDNSFGLTGWSGSDYIKLNAETVFGGGKSQTGNYWNYRFTFFTIGTNGSSTLSTSYTTSKQNIFEIRAYGNSWWTKGNDYAAQDHIYSWDKDQNVSFPASLSFSNSSSKKALLNASSLTTNRTFSFPDKTGTIALVSDIPTSFSSSNITGLKTLTIGSSSCQVFAEADITIPIYNGTIENTLLAAEGVSF